jgi:hypothetical protein
MYKLEDIAYFAGIVDGEGSIGIELLSPTKSRKKTYYVCRLCVINTNLALMQWIKENFGGTFDAKAPKIPNRKLCYRWHIFGKDLENLITALMPHLRIKKEQAQLLLRYRETVASQGWLITDDILEKRRLLHLRCKELNQLG